MSFVDTDPNAGRVDATADPFSGLDTPAAGGGFGAGTGGFGSGTGGFGTGNSGFGGSGASGSDLPQRVARLSKAMPLLKTDPQVLIAAAQQGGDDASMVQAALSAIGMQGIKKYSDELRARTPAEQRAAWNQADPNLQDILTKQTGYQPPSDAQHHQSLFGRILSDVTHPVSSLISHETQFLTKDILGPTFHTMRTAADVLPHFYRWMKDLEAGGQPTQSWANQQSTFFSGLVHPSRWGRAWEETGNGDRYFGPAAQDKARDILGGDPQALTVAMETAGSKSWEDAATRLLKPFQPGSQAQHEQALQYETLRDTPEFQKAVTELQRGRVTIGRGLVQGFTGLRPGDKYEGLLSGLTDAGIGWFADPTLLLGKMAHGVELARVGVNIGKDLVSVIEDGQKIYKATERISQIYDQSKPVQQAFDLISHHMNEGTFSDLYQKLPGSVTLVDPLKDYMRFREIGTTTPQVLKDFFSDADGLQQLASGAGKLGSRDQLILPNLTRRAMAGAETKAWLRKAITYTDDGAIDFHRALNGEDVVLDGVMPGGGGLAAGDTNRLINNPIGRRTIVPAAGFTRALLTHVPTERTFSMFGPEAAKELQSLTELGALTNMPSVARTAWFDTIMGSASDAERMQGVQGFLRAMGTTAGAFDKPSILGEQLNAMIDRLDHVYAAGDLDKLGTETGFRRVGVLAEADRAIQMPIPGARDLMAGVKQIQMQHSLMGWADSATAEHFMNVWRPLTLIKLGFVPRAGGEELARFVAQYGPTAWVKAKALTTVATSASDDEELLTRIAQAQSVGDTRVVDYLEQRLQDPNRDLIKTARLVQGQFDRLAIDPRQLKKAAELRSAGDEAGANAIIDALNNPAARATTRYAVSKVAFGAGNRMMEGVKGGSTDWLDGMAHQALRWYSGAVRTGLEHVLSDEDIRLAKEAMMNPNVQRAYMRALTFGEAGVLDRPLDPAKKVFVGDKDSLREIQVLPVGGKWDEYVPGDLYYANSYNQGVTRFASDDAVGQEVGKVMARYVGSDLAREAQGITTNPALLDASVHADHRLGGHAVLTHQLGLMRDEKISSKTLDDIIMMLRDPHTSVPNLEISILTRTSEVKMMTPAERVKEYLARDFKGVADKQAKIDEITRLAEAGPRQRQFLAYHLSNGTDPATLITDPDMMESQIVDAARRKLSSPEMAPNVQASERSVKTSLTNRDVLHPLPHDMAAVYTPQVDRTTAEVLAQRSADPVQLGALVRDVASADGSAEAKRLLIESLNYTTPAERQLALDHLDMHSMGGLVPGAHIAVSDHELALEMSRILHAVTDAPDGAPMIGKLIRPRTQLMNHKDFGTGVVTRMSDEAGKATDAWHIDPTVVTKVKNLGDELVNAGGHMMDNAATLDEALSEWAQVYSKRASQLFQSSSGDDVLHETLAPALDGKSKVRHIFDIPDRDLPPSVNGPVYRVPMEKDGLFNRFVRFGYDRMIGPGMESLIRQPMYLHNWMRAYTDAEGLLPALRDTALHADLEAVAKRGGMSSPDELIAAFHALPEELKSPSVPFTVFQRSAPAEFPAMAPENLAKVRRAAQEDFHIREMLRDTASNRAITETLPYIHDHRVRSQYQEWAHNITPFWFAEEQHLKRWGRLLRYAPETLQKAQLTMMGLKSTGFIRQDPTTGEDLFIYPMTPALGAAINSVAHHFFGGPPLTPWASGMTGQVKYLGAGWDQFAVPGLGPLAAFPLKGLTHFFPELGELKQALNHGRVQDPGVIRSIAPSWMQGVYDTLRQDPLDGHSRYGSALVTAMTLRAANGDFDGMNEFSDHEKQVMLDQVRGQARSIVGMQTLLGFLGPTTPQMRPEGGSALGLTANLTVGKSLDLHPEFIQLLRELGVEQASQVFLKRHPDATPFTVFPTSKPSGAPLTPSTTGGKWLADNAAWVHQVPNAAAWLMPPGASTDPFDHKTYYQQVADEMRVRKGPEEMWRDIHFAAAAPIYFDQSDKVQAMLDAATQAGDRATVAQINAEWKSWKDSYFNQHPIFAQKLADPTAENQRTKVLEELRAALSDPARPDTPMAAALGPLVKAYDRFVDLNQGIYGDRRTAAAIYRKQVSQRLADFGAVYVIQHPETEPFWRGVIKPLARLSQTGTSSTTTVTTNA